MADLFQNKYRISSVRLQSWNYANAGMYFITICTKNRECYFGKIIVETQCIASLQQPALNSTEIGKIAYDEWFKTPELRPDMNLELGEFVVMPNHIHGIICIGENEYNHDGHGRDAMHCVSIEYKNQFTPQSKNISSIIRGYKSAVTTYARKNNIPFNWQSRFHDHVIRSKDEYARISDYIINNPVKWRDDKFYQKPIINDELNHNKKATLNR
jgi:REP element-mobilizing transposase RayT